MTVAPQTLWEIDQEIEEIVLSCVDQETGEISEEASALLDMMEIKLEEKILNCGLVIDGHISEAEQVEKVAKQLMARAKQHRNYADWILRYVERHAPTDSKFKISDPRVVIDRAISQRVEPSHDAWTDDEMREFIHPDYLKEKVTLSIDKTAARKVLKTGEVIKGLVLTTYNKLRVKRGPSVSS